MKQLSIILLFLGFANFALSQSNTPLQQEAIPTITEEQLENYTSANDDTETEDDSYLQELEHFLKHPLNINSANEQELKQLQLLSPMQIQSLLDYRKLLGSLLDIYELQAIPYWDIATIQKARPYLSVAIPVNFAASIGQRLREGNYTFLARVSQILEKSKGYQLDSSIAKNFYPGSPQKLLLRLKYSYKNLLQYGFTAEKDAGEQFFKGAQKQGLDFYSFHFFARNIGKIKALAIGDYSVNLGQGLTQWMSLAFGKGADIFSIKRQAGVLRPYNSAGEIFFHRGAAITVSHKKFETTLFASYKHIDANFITDTSASNEDYISSLQTSGLHRTANEVADKNVQRQVAYGGNIKYKLGIVALGLNAVQYNFKYPLQKQAEPYNLFSLSGKNFGNYSLDYGFTRNNFHFFGEAAMSSNKNLAFVSGMMMSVAQNADVSILYRNISKSYQALYASAFTESSSTTNEKGLFAGISVRPAPAWKIDAYTDLFSFQWLKYNINAPSAGKEFFGQITYKPNKQLEIYSRFRSETKSSNLTDGISVLKPVVSVPKQNWRSHINYKVSPSVWLRSRVELSWYNKHETTASQGFLAYADILYKPMLSKFSGSLRLQYFETDDYNSRLYAYENDVLYSYSIPVFYGKGYRLYTNFNYKASRRVELWAKLGQTLFSGVSTIGSGLDEIRGSAKTEVKLQLQYKF